MLFFFQIFAPQGPCAGRWGPHGGPLGPPNWTKSSPEKPFRSSGPPWPPGAILHFFSGPMGGAQGGPRKPRGVPKGTLGDPWRPQKCSETIENVYLRLRGIPGWHLGKTPKTAARVGKVVQNEGVQNEVARGPGHPPGPPSGVPKGLATIDPIGVGPVLVTPTLKNVVLAKGGILLLYMRSGWWLQAPPHGMVSLEVLILVDFSLDFSDVY